MTWVILGVALGLGLFLVLSARGDGGDALPTLSTALSTVSKQAAKVIVTKASLTFSPKSRALTGWAGARRFHVTLRPSVASPAVPPGRHVVRSHGPHRFHGQVFSLARVGQGPRGRPLLFFTERGHGKCYFEPGEAQQLAVALAASDGAMLVVTG
jgi:hypothetical protein